MPDEDLLVFGYACKLFRDDEKAQEAEQMLIPWNGDNDLLISRSAWLLLCTIISF